MEENDKNIFTNSFIEGIKSSPKKALRLLKIICIVILSIIGIALFIWGGHSLLGEMSQLDWIVFLLILVLLK